MADAQKAAAQAVTTDAELSLLDQIVEQGKMGKDAESKGRGKDLVKRFVSEVLEGAITINRDTETMINARIAQIDHLLSLQLNEILHHPEFQKLEGSWRGLQYLLKQSETGTMLKIKVLNVSKKDLLRDLQRAPEFDQSALFKKVYEEEYGVFGGTPFGALVGDYQFDRSGQDIELLEKISNVAAAAHAPFMTAASHEMLNLESWADLDTPRDLAKIFDSTEYAKWKSFRSSDDARYVALTAPRVLMREPYGSTTVPIEAFNYEERVDGTNHDHYCWGNAAYAMAANVNKAFAMYGWTASIRGVESGGLVEGLPVHNFRTEAGEIAMKCPTETQITDRREKELADLGFAPLVHQKGTANAAFFSVQSAQKAKVYDDPAASSSARMSAQLPYIFSTSRFAHYLKVMMRDKIGGYTTRAETESFLNRWIQNYVAPSNASGSLKSKLPLSEARIDVVDVPGKPGVFRAVAFMKPHFQLDELAVSMRLVADLPPAAA
ncbi:MAG: type VI secretion system contractile sheath large subunit [Gemmatimonadota bacterium]|jgi:type VI secretion system protein ImpC|nr:type VI secretion system contractile sheath large subunit [Gemmatimonadota bacterium]MDQ8166506.1 type VI secretion system contractile sheath large subunit [Gemmatimonadota bacterium]MDQ8172386.1 type VI secretion system contractile sheath large subunit [Gemmatimonadota bacterium]